ncbi:MAG: AAA family ATPase [Patescibacteria group bacterium]|nr:AAA family ATPase [Patescibacteria group bacterium]
MGKLVLGLVGKFGAGKSLVAMHLEKRGFLKITLSDFLREKAKARGQEPNRDVLQNLGNELREKFGIGVLSQLAWERIYQSKVSLAVIDGIRNPGEVEFFRMKDNFYLLKIEADEEIRFQRLLQNSDPRYPKTWEEFAMTEKRDLGEGEKESGQQVGEVLKMADSTIFNEETEEKLYQKVDDLIVRLTASS